MTASALTKYNLINSKRQLSGGTALHIRELSLYFLGVFDVYLLRLVFCAITCLPDTLQWRFVNHPLTYSDLQLHRLFQIIRATAPFGAVALCYLCQPSQLAVRYQRSLIPVEDGSVTDTGCDEVFFVELQNYDFRRLVFIQLFH